MTLEETATDTYDLMPDPGYPFPRTHPDNLAVVGSLFGIDVAPVTKCRVLELGCSNGGNIIPMAKILPDSEFVGIDQSKSQDWVTNQWHTVVPPRPVARLFLQLADGQHTVTEMVATALRMHEAGKIDMEGEGDAVSEIQRNIRGALDLFARNGLLVA
jgi:hypothetical protein